MDAVHELLARAVECCNSDDLDGCRKALEQAAPMLEPEPKEDPNEPQLAADLGQAARLAFCAGDEGLAHQYATKLLTQVSWTVKTLLEPVGDEHERVNKLILAKVINEIRPDLDNANWSNWAKKAPTPTSPL